MNQIIRWTGWSDFHAARRTEPQLSLDAYLYFASDRARIDADRAADYGGYLPLPDHIPLAVVYETPTLTQLQQAN